MGSPCRQSWTPSPFSHLHLPVGEICSDSEPPTSRRRRRWCNIILKALWMERVTPVAFMWLSRKSWRQPRFTSWFWWWETSNMHEYGKGGLGLIDGGLGGALLTATLSRLGFDQEQTVASFLCYRAMHERISQTGTTRTNPGVERRVYHS